MMARTAPTLPRLCAALLLLLAGAQATVHAQQPTAHHCGRTAAHPIDAAYAAAMERSGGVTVDMRDAQSTAYAAWDKELNRLYAQVLKAAGSARRDSLRAAQRAWLAFDKAQAQWDMAVHADQGSSAALNVAGAGLARLRARVCDLDTDLQALKDSP
jgi:uncharacterized protein YecT (DUF1311 family)